MDRVRIDIDREDIADALREQAASHGRSIEEELAAVVAQGVSAKRPLVDRLLAICGEDNEIYLPVRDLITEEHIFFDHDFS
jgi:plasmid stability protein